MRGDLPQKSPMSRGGAFGLGLPAAGELGPLQRPAPRQRMRAELRFGPGLWWGDGLTGHGLCQLRADSGT